MNKRLPWILALVLAVIAVVVWRSRSDDAAVPSPTAGSAARGSSEVAKARVVTATPRPDPKTLGRGSLAGTVTVDDATKAPIAGAQICAYGRSNVLATDLMRQPMCAIADAQGRYTIANLLPAEYRVGANAKTYRPATYHPDGFIIEQPATRTLRGVVPRCVAGRADCGFGNTFVQQADLLRY